MENELSIPVNHDDFIHDIAYNFYGTRLATCGSDRCIKIWDWNKQSGLWILNESIQAHDSSVVGLSWAHPEFGQVLASCSLDRVVRIWAEQETNMPNSGTRWKSLRSITESTAAVHSVEFAPEYTGLSVAAASSDGKVRLYLPSDPVNLENWSIKNEIDFVPGGATDADGPLSLSWCKARFAPSGMLVVGGSKHNQVKVYRLHPNTGFKVMAELAQYDSKVLDVDWAPSMGRSYHLIATATADGHVRIYKFWSEPSLAETLLSDSMFVREGDDLEGSDADVDTALLGDDDEDDEDDEDSASVDDGDDDDDDDEDDEDDADDEEGDDYNYAANGNTGGSNDGHSDDEGAGTGDSDGGSGKRARGGRRTGAGAGRGASTTRAPCFELVVDLSVQPSVPIRRVKWNSAGTSLISCSDDGVTRIWKATVKGTWREVMAIAAEKSAAAEA